VGWLRAIGPGAVLLIWVLAGGCAPDSALISRNSEVPLPSRIALLPVSDMAQVYGVAQSIRSPLTGKVFVTGQTAPELAGLITAEVDTHLRNLGYDVVSPDAIGSVMATLSADQSRKPGERALLVAASRQVEAGAILVGYLYRIQERQGARFAVRQPASVAYGLYLIDARKGAILWSGEFDETQRSLDEDLFAVGTFIRRRGEWINAAQMATAGLREMLAAFPAPAGALAGAGD
jgi:hypothetical protein